MLTQGEMRGMTLFTNCPDEEKTGKHFTGRFGAGQVKDIAKAFEILLPVVGDILGEEEIFGHFIDVGEFFVRAGERGVGVEIF
ncbi:hypothetical protein HK097_006477 [Rhizophlyctis rosea]|uniref:Uncharacterized protein n=1 Tax=Rhizophlyctis rosea TaxID=64517 RepID=A0AAD5S121_9FUNG|nr:hypothetical protein HK097_006477 [Rhizophlyctis rosea]